MRMSLVSFLLLSCLCLSCKDDVPIANNSSMSPVEKTNDPSGEDAEEGELKTSIDYDSTLIVKINPKVKYQEIDCFGASGAWLGEFVGKYWDTNTKDKIAELLFSTEIIDGHPQGIGLSHWRVNLGAGTMFPLKDGGIGEVRRTECFLNEDGTYTWDNRCLGQQYFMRKAKEFGCNLFTLFSCTPPVYYTNNGFGYSSSGAYANLQEDKYDDFADYLASVAQFYVQQGYNIRFISPVNEPQSNWDTPAQEGSGWQRDQIARIVNELDTKLTEKNLHDVKILLAEPSYWWFFNKDNGSGRGDLLWHLFASDSPNCVLGLSHVPSLVCSHSYGIDTSWEVMQQPRVDARLTAEYFHIEKLYQSEWCMVPHGTPYEECPNIDQADEIDLALAMSKVIHQDLVSAQVSGWFYWTALDQKWGNKNQYSLIYVTPMNGDHGDIKNSGTYSANKNLWTLGNYSLFIRPGARRIDLNIAGQNGKFFGTAYLSADEKKIIVVYSNCTKKTIKVEGEILDDLYSVKQIGQYVTSKEKNLSLETEEYWGIVPARSVVTMIYEY